MQSFAESTFLGFDWSTQKLKAIVVSDELEILQEAEVHYDSDLPKYRTNGGVVRKEKGEVLSPPLMWVEALDLALDRLIIAGADYSNVAAVSGCGQQHGSVWWAKGCDNLLASLDNSKFLYEQLALAFSLLESPTWMDSSTQKWCDKLQHAVGGPQELALITGSRAYERFTGSQIAKIFENKKRLYETTERISLVSSFACSLLTGRVAPLDFADASGMNLMDIHAKTWHPPCLQACGDDSLEKKLGTPVASQECIGPISSYFVEKFGFQEKCQVIAFTGDNPSTVAGMRLSREWVAVSLGTSDTLLLWLENPLAAEDGHVLCCPLERDAYSALLCFANGSLAREAARDRLAGGSWDTFNAMLDSTPRGNFGNLGLFFDSPEIVPKGAPAGRWMWGQNGATINKMAPDTEIRALLEGQFIARKVHAEDMGFVIDKDTKILATGGASANKSLLQVMSDVFNAPVYVQDTSNSAVLGAAYRARHGLLCHTAQPVSFAAATSSAPPPALVCTPYSDAQQVYGPMLLRYRDYIATIVKENRQN